MATHLRSFLTSSLVVAAIVSTIGCSSSNKNNTPSGGTPGVTGGSTSTTGGSPFNRYRWQYID